jgi:hypothetical protein
VGFLDDSETDFYMSASDQSGCVVFCVFRLSMVLVRSAFGPILDLEEDEYSFKKRPGRQKTVGVTANVSS